ncbi:MAG: tyrosine-protein kinase Etk/Wzc [Myxococcales bacterium]|jgi:capsular exopolysaccharide synthesis family protein|nr:tyrosine-protein kinase Etk/Wzc [Myxococcales bacterium]
MGAEQFGRGDTGERMTLTDVGLILLRQRRTIAACAVVVLGAVMAVTLLSPMKFRARGSLYLGELQEARPSQSTLPEQLDFLGGRSGDVGTEIEILKSRTLIKRAVLTSGLNVGLAPSGWHPPPYWRWRLEHRIPHLLDVGPRQVLASGGELADARAGVSTFTVRFGQAGAYEIGDGPRRLGTGTLGTPFKEGGLSITLLPGPEGPPAMGATFTLYLTSADEIADAAGKELSVTMPKTGGPGEAVKVVTVEYRHPSPRAAAAFVATLMRAYLESRQNWKVEEATAAETFVSSQAQAIKRELDTAEQQLAEYKAHSNVVALGDESRGLIDQLGKYEEQRVAARLQVDAFDRIQEVLVKPGAAVERYLMGEKEDPVLASLSNNLALARQELQHIEERFTGEAPATLEQRAQVNNQLKMVKDYVVGRSARAQKQLASLNQMIGQFEGKLKTVPAAELALAQLTRSAEVLGKMYSFLIERQQQATVTKASTISRSRILDTPETPYREDAPVLTLRLVLGALMGLLLGVVVVVLRWALSGQFQSDKQVRRALGQIPLWAAIPHDDLRKRKGASPAFAEAFRHLRTSLYCDGAGAGAVGNKVVVVTSPSAGDGKTLCTISLATALATDGKRVLVIEADMHRPSLRALLPIHPGGDLADLLTGRRSWFDVITTVPVGNRGFDVIAAHAVHLDSTELLSSPRFAEILDYARSRYDFVLIDSPPFPLLSDALILSLQAGRVISVLRLGNTTRAAAERHLQGLAVANARHGAVVNDADADAAVDAYYQPSATRASRPDISKDQRASAPAA